MATNKIIYSGETLIDLTSDTITEEALVEGYTAHNRSGEVITGTLSEATEEKKGLMSASDKIKLNKVSSTELGYLSGVTSKVQTQLNNKLPLSGGTLNDGATIKLSTYGTRFLTLTGNSISADMSKETGGWAGNFSSVKDPAGDTTALLGWYGNEAGLIHIYMGGTYNSPYMKMTKAGLFTFANLVTASGGLQSNIFKAPTAAGGSTYGVGSNGQVLKSNGSTLYWGTDNNTTYDVATASANGLMSKTDKSNLDTIVNSFNNDDSNTTIDTIKEVLKAFENAPEGTNIANALSGKVDKVDGKGLSTNDFTTAYKNKLDGIASGAEVNVQSDWNATSGDAFIKNKPTLFSGNYNDLTNKPTIPTVNNGQLTIQKNGTNVATFTANQSGNATANITVPTKVSELTNDSGFTTNTGTVTSVKIGSTSYSPSSGVVSLPAYPSNYVPKTTYEWSKELACGSNGKVCLGKFGAYDTNITINITSTTSVTYNATIVIQSQNIVANGTGGSCKVDVYGDANNAITPLLSIFRPYGSASRQIEVYANLAGWSKNIVHVQAVALSDGGGTDILTSVDTIPTSISGKTKVTPTNVLKANFGTSNFSGNYNDLTNKPTIPTNTWRGIQDNLTSTSTTDSLSANQGKVLNDKFASYLPLAGGTMTGAIVTRENAMALKFRTHASSYEGGIVYGTTGNEALTIAMQNPVTAFQIVYGTKPSAYASNTWQSVTPLFQTKDGKVIINRKITATSETSNLKLLDVNGEMAATGITLRQSDGKYVNLSTASGLTANRDIVFPDSSGTVATQTWVNSAIASAITTAINSSY